ncbi:MAG: hypothetical protein Unbinned7837contig1000_28 [Prokaryotic dsDNA virus sp.]|nr:MAG: hypothetical protein Unbinned7837contig1000_28 [Prokaryotic dsDNA virus sp.]
MGMIIEQYTFYNDGNLYNNIQRAASKRQYEDVPEKAELSIIIVGTEKQNDILFKKYIKQHNLALDECYDITNDMYAAHYNTLKKRYNKNNKKAFIL